MEKQERKLLRAKRILRQKRYIRLGECNFCGDCCEREGPDGGPCEYLNRISPDFAICTVYGKPERYARCPLFPEAPQHPFKRCGYFFQDRHEGGKRYYPEDWPGPQNFLENLDDSDNFRD